MTFDQSLSSWRVELQGDDAVLKQLPARFSSAACSVLEIDGFFFLVSSEFAQADDPGGVNSRATEIVHTLNLIGRVALAQFRPVRSGAVVRILPSGVTRTLIIGEAHCRVLAPECSVKAVVIGPDGKEKIDPVHTLNHEFAKTTKEPNLAEALAHFAGTGFVELWKCFEVIRQHAPMLLKTRATRNEISRFTEACQPERHARFRGRRSGIAATYKTMSIEEAREFLRNMLLAWMQ